MHALLLTAPSKLELLEYPKPEYGEDDVLVRIKACGICGSDIHGWDGSSGRRIPPLIMGHEAAGEVAAIGSAVQALNVGDRVTFDSTISCGRCSFCKTGQVNLCEARRVLGVSVPDYRQHGAFAEFAVVPRRIIYPIPDDMPFRHAAMIEPVSIAVHAVRRVTISPTDCAVVVGTGMIGMLVVQALRWAGAKRIIAVDKEGARLALARELGASDAIQSDSANVPAEIAKLTGGLGADLVFEAVGISPTVQLALQIVRRSGSVVLVGNLAQKIDFPLQSVVTRELKIFGTCGSAGEYPLCIDLVARGEIQVEPLISELAPLNDGAEWFQRLSAPGGARFLKIILQP